MKMPFKVGQRCGIRIHRLRMSHNTVVNHLLAPLKETVPCWDEVGMCSVVQQELGLFAEVKTFFIFNTTV